MKDALGNVVNRGDYVVCCLGASYNQNNSALVPCEVTKVNDNTVVLNVAKDIATYGNGKYNSVSRTYGFTKRSHQIVKINKFMKKF
ncbi:MAG: hypothetical protein J6D03_10560 [Clostridia bacterium]|nr:hypothetical protein [Clostridia bacterium]